MVAVSPGLATVPGGMGPTPFQLLILCANEETMYLGSCKGYIFIWQVGTNKVIPILSWDFVLWETIADIWRLVFS